MLIGAGIGIPFQQNVLARLLGSAEYFAPLTHSLVPTRGTGTATYSRATTAVVKDHESVLRTAIAGEARFEGARRVRNLLAGSSEDFNNASWTKSVGGSGVLPVLTSGQTDPDGGTSAWRMQFDAGVTGGSFSLLRQLAMSGAGNLAHIWMKSNTGVSQTAHFGSFTVGLTKAFTVTTEWQQFSTKYSSVAGGYDIGTYPAGTGSQQALDILVWHPQFEDITGRADQTTPSEYVSVGVLSAPYHGAGVDGVKFFNTDLDGSLIPAATNTGYVPELARTNLCLQSNAFTTTWSASGTPAATQNVVGPDGATSAWTLTDDDAGVLEGVYIANTLTAATYTASVFVKKTVGAQSSYPGIYLKTGTTIAPVVVDTTNGIATAFSAYTGNTIAGGLTARCTSFNADYWRVEITFTGTVAAWNYLLAPAATTNATQSTGSFAVNVTGSAVFYGAQVELGSSATSYIATTTAAVTRNADVESNPTAGNITAAAGSIYLEYTPHHAPSGTVFLWGTYVDASNYTAILHDGTNLIFRKRIAATNYDATIANAFTANTTYKACATWGTAGTSITLNGTEGTPHANTTAAQIAATMQWGADGNSLQQLGGAERNARVWQRQISTSERAAITS